MIVLLAPGPSMSKALADSVMHCRVGAVTSALPLAPWAEFVAASDQSWWRKMGAAGFDGECYSAHKMPGVEQVEGVTTATNSGVLALQVCKMKGAKSVALLGFDMGLGHYFGNYMNGLSNTDKHRRRVHMQQYAQWQRANPDIDVINCTPGSALECFRRESFANVVHLFRSQAEPERIGAEGIHRVPEIA